MARRSAQTAAGIPQSQRQRVRQNFLPHKMQRLPKASDILTEDEMLPKAVKLRQNKYLNNQIEQDHHFIKRLVNQVWALARSTQRDERLEDLKR